MDLEVSQSKSLDAKEAARLLHLAGTYNQWTKALEAALGEPFVENIDQQITQQTVLWHSAV